MKSLLTLFAVIALAPGLFAEKPNILWVYAEDTSPWMGCYGSKANANATPNIDSLAKSGLRFARAFVPAPVCSACRSAMMMGQSQIRFGAHEHRSSRGEAKLYLPKGAKLLPQIMKESGYYTFNHGKTDYNFVWNTDAVYSDNRNRGGTDFNVLKKNQPFFGQIQTKGGKNNTTRFPAERKTNPNDVTVPPDYPQNQLYREVVAQHHDAIRVDDDRIGTIMQGLKDAGLLKNTIVVYFSDHGANNLVRHKQMPTEGGLHVPFIITGPKHYVSQRGVRNDLVNMLDLPATTLAWAGIAQPDWYEGQNLFAKDFHPRESVAGGKDRLDHTLDRVRTVRTDRFRYTRNFKLDRIFLQPQYRDRRDFVQNLHVLYRSGKLPQKLRDIYFGERPAEEFYEVSKDPSQMNNLVGDPKYAVELNRHRRLLDTWLSKGDMGVAEESVAMMRNNADGKKWGNGVNPEYEVYRADNDGDGLSDAWETTNERNPSDGLLRFEFDCGGWQTEGWEADGIRDNIAGYLGYLDFAMTQWKGVMRRDGLNAIAMANDKTLAVTLRCEAPLRVQAYANATKIAGERKVIAGKKFTTVRFPLKDQAAWKGYIRSLELELFAKKGSKVEIDSIKVER